MLWSVHERAQGKSISEILEGMDVGEKAISKEAEKGRVKEWNLNNIL